MSPVTIRLAGAPVEIRPLSFGSLRRILPRVAEGVAWYNLRLRDFPAFVAGADAGLAIAVTMIAAATGRTEADVEEIPATLMEGADAILAIADLSGVLRKAGSEDTGPGEVMGVTSTGG